MSNAEKSDDPVIVKNGYIYYRLSDGRYWCPSSQFRDGSPVRRSSRSSSSPLRSQTTTPLKFPKYSTFTAVDFETATTDRFICQVGLVSVKDGIISERLSVLVQPPFNKYDKFTMHVHNITPEDTQNALTFDKVWKDISHYFENSVVVAHNSSFDEDALRKNLQYYFISDELINPFICTCQLYRHEANNIGETINAGLKDLCMAFHIPYTNHHDALFDAECCAKFYLNYVNGVSPDYSLIQKECHAATNSSSASISSIFNRPISETAKNLFSGKKCVITGEFDVERETLKSYFQNLGAKFTSSISSATDYVIMGQNAGPSKMKKIEELQQAGGKIKVFHADDIISLLNPEQQ